MWSANALATNFVVEFELLLVEVPVEDPELDDAGPDPRKEGKIAIPVAITRPAMTTAAAKST